MQQENKDVNLEQGISVQEEVSREDQLQTQIDQLRRENEELKNQYFKAYADADNFKKRTQKEMENVLKYKAQSIASKLLPVLDNLERALASETSDQQFKLGVQMVYDQIVALLKDEGVVEVEALNQPFDGNYHQSLGSEKVDDVESNIVIEVFQKGYLLKDRILRPSLVKVSE